MTDGEFERGRGARDEGRPDENEESPLGAVVEADADGAPVLIVDRAERLAVEHDAGDDPARDETDETGDGDAARALD